MPSEYKLNEVEQKRFDKFSKKHLKKCLSSVAVTFSSSSGIGQTVSIHCLQCGKTKDITDYGCW